VYAANRAGKLVSKFGACSAEIANFITQLKKEQEDQRYQTTIERTVPSACTLTALKVST
jgi:hypothetical protein